MGMCRCMKKKANIFHSYPLVLSLLTSSKLVKAVPYHAAVIDAAKATNKIRVVNVCITYDAGDDEKCFWSS